jgi:hypothetical protein
MKLHNFGMRIAFSERNYPLAVRLLAGHFGLDAEEIRPEDIKVFFSRSVSEVAIHKDGATYRWWIGSAGSVRTYFASTVASSPGTRSPIAAVITVPAE